MHRTVFIVAFTALAPLAALHAADTNDWKLDAPPEKRTPLCSPMHHAAAIDVDCLASHFARPSAAQEHDHRSDVFRLLPSS